jgi:hypothetical protein
MKVDAINAVVEITVNLLSMSSTDRHTLHIIEIIAKLVELYFILCDPTR